MMTDYILLVDDNPDDRDLTRLAFEAAGITCELVIAPDALSALELLQARMASTGQGPCIIFADLKMPKMDGFALLRHIQADARTKDIPVVIMTSSDEEKDFLECRRLGASGYLRKTVDGHIFVAKLQRFWSKWKAGVHPANQTWADWLG